MADLLAPDFNRSFVDLIYTLAKYVAHAACHHRFRPTPLFIFVVVYCLLGSMMCIKGHSNVKGLQKITKVAE